MPTSVLEAYRIAQVEVLTPLGDDLTPLLIRAKNGLGRHRNGGGVYDDLRILEATRRLLAEKPEVSIPDDNRYLVEAATHPARLEALQAELGEAWQSLAAKLEGDTSAEKTIGHLHTLNVEQRVWRRGISHRRSSRHPARRAGPSGAL
jgi:CRISPR-associated endonuclease/helicase Cas3